MEVIGLSKSFRSPIFTEMFRAPHNTGTSKILTHHPNISLILQEGETEAHTAEALAQGHGPELYSFPPVFTFNFRAGYRTIQWPRDSGQVTEHF